MTYLAVALGGAFGTLMRYIIASSIQKIVGLNFPYWTLFINISGSFLIGVFTGLFVRYNVSDPALRAFLTIGICGGYTTFSTFSMETYLMMENHHYASAAIYIAASVTLSILALMTGLILVRANLA